MTAMFVSVQAVREYLSLNAPGTDSKYTDATIGSNIRAAGWTLEQAIGRYLGAQTLTLKFSTDGRAQMFIPGLATATSVTLQGATLVADQSYWLLPDEAQSGVYMGIQFRAFRRQGSDPNWYLGNPEWFDRDLDSWRMQYGMGGTIPNDLVITGVWGYTDIPEPALEAVKRLAAWYTLRPDALLSGTKFTPDGAIFDLSRYPTEVAAFIADWKAEEGAVLVG